MMKEKCLITYQQKLLLMRGILYPDDTAYNMMECVKIEGKLDKKRLFDALRNVYKKERILRVGYEKVADNIFQGIYDEDITITDEKIAKEAFFEAVKKEKEKPFDIFKDKLIRMHLYQVAEDEYYLLLVLHHSICDGWSLRVLSNKIISLYTGKDYESSDDYLDYAIFQNEEGTCEKNTLYWKEYLEDKECKVDFAFYQDKTFADEKIVEQELDEAYCMKIVDYCKKNAITPFVFFYGCFNYLLYKYSNQEEIVVAVPFANRLNRKWSQTIGCFVNPYPMYYNFNQEMDCKSYFKQLFKTMITGVAKADAPIDMKCNMAFSFMNFEKVEKICVEEITIEPVKIQDYSSKFDIELTAYDKDGKYIFNWIYDKSKLNHSSMKVIQEHFFQIMKSFLEADDTSSIFDIEMLHEEELFQQKVGWNETEHQYDTSINMIECIKAAFEKYGDYMALKYQDKEITYREFSKKAYSLARRLQQKGVGKGDIVAIQFDRSFEMVIAIYGIVLIGATYLPIVMNTPAKRMEHILNNSQAVLLLCKEKDTVKECGCEVLEIAFDALEISEEEYTRMIDQHIDIDGEDTIYCIYTSGSTGEPKGVINTHQGLINRIYWMHEQYGLKEKDAVLQKTPYTFDVSVWEFFWPIMFGGKLVIAEPEEHKNPIYIQNIIVKEQIAFIHFVPSMLNIFLKNQKVSLCKSLKTVICSGEELKADTVEIFYRLLDAKLANLYGPTEAAIDVSYHDMETYQGEKSIPIGKPIANIKLYKLDKHKKFSPKHVPGELYISGIGLAKGYLNKPDLTNEKFVKNPYGDGIYSKMYETGDLVRIEDNGSIIYLARLDNQVKLNGQRIEIQEIEECMAKFPGVDQAVVIVDKNKFGEQYLYGCVVGKVTIEKNDLIRFMKSELMEYMVPHIIFQIEEIPLSANGKLDRKKIKEICASSIEIQCVPPETKVEKVIVSEMERVLQRENIGLNDDYFLLGGNSLRMVDMISGISQRLDIEIPYKMLIKNPVVKDLAKEVEEFIRNQSRKKEDEIDINKEIATNICICHEETKQSVGKKVFLTGATGFLGAYLLRNLLEDMDVDVFCLVRAENQRVAKEKIQRKLASADMWKPEYEKRIHVMVGNLDQNGLGLAKEEVEFIEKEIDYILHNGANVNFSIPYESIKKENVEATKYILKMLSSGKRKKMVYISTASIFSEQAYKDGAVTEDNYPNDINHLGLGYTQSKMVCEHIIKQYMDKQEDITIIRLGRIIDDEKKHDSKDIFQLLLKICKNMKKYPVIEDYFDILPVRIAGEVITKILFCKDSKKVYHLVNPDLISVEEIGKLLTRFIPDMEKVSWENWINQCNKEAKIGNELAKSVVVVLGGEYVESDYKKIIMDHCKEFMDLNQITIPNKETILEKYLKLEEE